MRHVEVDLRGRGAAGAMLAAGAVLPLVHPGTGLPCPLRTLTGIPCPVCGATTSVEATLHAHPLTALAANPLGPLLVGLAVVALVRPPRHALRVPLHLVLAAAVALWAFELRRFGLI
ncbi:MAG TPA: DUF2752 domain-containing protein [Gaiellaceae bacterium]|nr:DUF2752 domain-containing protein [Gaiellaceae bacterium]